MGWASWSTGATGTKVVDIAFTNGGNAARTALLQVNGPLPATVSFPPPVSGAVALDHGPGHGAQGSDPVMYR